MKYLIEIAADWNDADYVNSSHEFSEKEWEKLEPIFTKVIDAIKKWKKSHPGNRHNWKDPITQYKGILTEEEINTFVDYAPNAYEHDSDIYMIESIVIHEVSKTKTLL